MMAPLSSASDLTPLSNKSPLLYADQCRRAQQLPEELIQHIQAYYEEDLNAQGFDFLHSITSNSVSALDPLAKAVYPPASHVALAATIAVHPNTTTRTVDPAKLAQSAAAIRLLRLLLRVGAVYPPFQSAFRFRKYQGNFFHLTPKTQRDEINHFETRYQYTEANSLFQRADDFWHLIGWAFNCACLPDMYAERWKHYESFLEFMISTIEQDYEYHQNEEQLESSLFWSYIELANGGAGRARRILRAIFANGSTRDLNEFREIFNKELKPPTKKQDDHIKKEVDLDHDIFGDYANPSSSNPSSDDDQRPSKRARVRSSRRTPSARTSNESLNSVYEDNTTTTTTGTNSTYLGSPTTLRMRTRLLRLLAEIAQQPSLIAHSASAFIPEDELYTLFVEFIKPLPLPIFQQFILPDTHPGTAFDAATHYRLCEAILERTLESRAPRNTDGSSLTPARLIEAYLQFTASGATVEAQAKVSLLIEALTRRLCSEGQLTRESPEMGVLNWAVEAGVREREDKARESMQIRKKGRKQVDEEEMWRALRESGERIRVAVKNIQ